MCVSSRSSLVLFLSGFIGSLALLYKTKDLKYLTIMFIIMMQLAEYFMWIDIESGGNYPSLNIIGNYIGIISLFLQTSGLIMFMPKKYGTISNCGTLGTIVLTINIIYYLVTTYIYTTAVLKTEKHQAFSSVGKSNTLSWAMVPNSSAFKMIGLIMFIISNIHNNIVYFNTYIYSFVNIFLIIISTKFVHSFHVEYFGSIYCYFGAISLVIYVVYELLKN